MNSECYIVLSSDTQIHTTIFLVINHNTPISLFQPSREVLLRVRFQARWIFCIPRNFSLCVLLFICSLAESEILPTALQLFSFTGCCCCSPAEWNTLCKTTSKKEGDYSWIPSHPWLLIAAQPALPWIPLLPLESSLPHRRNNIGYCCLTWRILCSVGVRKIFYSS